MTAEGGRGGGWGVGWRIGKSVTLLKAGHGKKAEGGLGRGGRDKDLKTRRGEGGIMW